ncbi:MAG: phasin family protein [Pseudomonadota bacterium]|nr:phasin family protein [Pseudomonadota bacterium]
MAARRSQRSSDTRAEETAEPRAHPFAAPPFATEALHRFSETAGQSAGQMGSLLSHGMKASEDVTRHATQGMDVMIQCSTVLADGAQSALKELAGYVQESMQMQMKAMTDMMHAHTLQEMLSVQGRIVREEMEACLNMGIRMSELSGRTGTDTVRRLAECCERTAFFHDERAGRDTGQKT